MFKPIDYVIGDATYPRGTGNKIIAHVCNDVGAWGSGFVMAISKRWKDPEEDFREAGTTWLSLGHIQMVDVEPDIKVANMVAQAGIGRDSNGRPPIRYEELDKCLAVLQMHANVIQASVHMPRIGCGLAGGRWEEILPLVSRNLSQRGVQVTVYDLHPPR